MEEKFMREALRLARAAADADEVPVGAVVVRDGKIIARANNKKERKGSAVYHAEINAILAACRRVGMWRLCGCEIYVTLEPCPMCAGALINSRIDKIFFGAYDPKAGACGTLYDLTGEGKLNHRPEVVGGVLEEECAAVLSEYFRRKRAEKRLNKETERC